MRIAIDIRNIGRKRTGDEVVFFNLVKNLAVIDKENEYLLLTDRNPEADADLKESIQLLQLGGNFKVVNLCNKGANKFIWNVWVLPNYLRKNPVDVLQVQYIAPFFVSRKIKIVTIVHDVSFKVFPQLVKKSDLFFLNLLMPMTLRRADRVVGVSKFTAQEIAKYYEIDEQKIVWIHNAVADNFAVEYAFEQKEAVRKKYNLPKDFILYIGTLQPRKNIPALIEAYIKVPITIRKNMELVLAGGRGHNFDLKIDEYVKSYSIEKYVSMPGFIDEADKPILMKMAKIFCFPSLYEGFGIPILEAMYLGVPVLASNIPPHAEITGGVVLLFDVNDSDDFARKMELIIKDDSLREKLSKNGIAQAKKFSWQKTAEKMLQIYQTIQ